MSSSSTTDITHPGSVKSATISSVSTSIAGSSETISESTESPKSAVPIASDSTTDSLDTSAMSSLVTVSENCVTVFDFTFAIGWVGLPDSGGIVWGIGGKSRVCLGVGDGVGVSVGVGGGVSHV